MAIVFGSPEAQAILARNRILGETDILDEVDEEWLEDVEAELEEEQEELDHLRESIEDEVDAIEARMMRLEEKLCPMTGLTYKAIRELHERRAALTR